MCRAFVEQQQVHLQQVAEMIVGLHTAGVLADEAPARGRGGWLFPGEGIAAAVADAYRQIGG